MTQQRYVNKLYFSSMALRRALVFWSHSGEFYNLCRLQVWNTITAIFIPCLNQFTLPCWQTRLITIPKAIQSNQFSGSRKYMQILHNWDLPDNGTFWVNSPLTNGHCGEWRSCSDLAANSGNNKANNTGLMLLLLHLLMYLMKHSQKQHNLNNLNTLYAVKTVN